MSEVLAHRLRAAAALPIRVADQVHGLLVVYGGEAGYFQEREVGLLEEAASDLSYAIESLAVAQQRRSAEARARSERLFSETIIESTPGVLYLYDSDGRFLRWNRNFEVASGYSSAEIAGMRPLDFFAPADRALLEERIGQVFSTGSGSVEAPFLAKDGGTTPYFFTGRRIEVDGRACLVGMGIDVSEKRRAEQALRASEERFRTTLDGVLEGCQLIGFDWRYLYLNDAAAVHNRRPNAELLGRTMPESWPGIESTELFAMLDRCMRERVALHRETEFVFLDGTSGWFDVRCQPVPEGIFVLSIDISERKSAELALLELNETLEHRVAERTTELAAALERAEAADRIKSAFLATMSHELRTPLNSIIGFTGILLQGLAGPLNAEQKKQLGMVRGSANHLLELINDVLDLSKIEAGQLEVRSEPVDLPKTIESAVGTIRPLAAKKGLDLRVAVGELPAQLSSDRRRVEQILLNLLNNAVKFTDRGSVSLTAERVEGGGPSADSAGEVRIRVADTGIGIPPEELGSLFRPFRQLDSGLTRQHEGTGLGLAICRRLSELLGGSVTATSEAGRGSEFTLRLPIRGES
jgi:PAS domain S-box-containing protein